MSGFHMASEKEGGAVAGAIDQEIQEKLGEKLKEAYSDVINEPVPDRFLDLLNQLAAGGPESGKNDTNE